MNIQIPKGLRVRFLIRAPLVLIFTAHGPAYSGGDWERVNRLRWTRFRGEKKAVTGRYTIVHVDAMPGWATEL